MSIPVPTMPTVFPFTVSLEYARNPADATSGFSVGQVVVTGRYTDPECDWLMEGETPRICLTNLVQSEVASMWYVPYMPHLMYRFPNVAE